MDRHRGERGGGGRQRGPSRWSDGPPNNQRHSSHGQPRGGGGGFDGGERHHPYRGGGGRGGAGEPDFPFGGGGRQQPFRGGGGGPQDYPSGGGRFHPYRGGDGPPEFPMGGGGGFGPAAFRHGPGGPVGYGHHGPMGGGQRRGGGFSSHGGGGSPDDSESSNFTKLFVGSVPRTATEDDIRPLFEEHGNVVEVAIIKDRRTGQQQGCCFVKYETLMEADRAIRALHNQITLPGGLGPIQVRYADGERERLGAGEFKLFVGSLNKQATEKEIEDIFAPYGRVEDVYIMKDDMKQSRGCGFVKYSNRDMASAAIDALNGKYTMRGCDQPLTVRFADPKKPRPGDSRGGAPFGSPDFGQRFQPPLGPSPWHSPGARSHGPSDGDIPSNMSNPASSFSGPRGPPGGLPSGPLPGPPPFPASIAQQGFSPAMAPIPMMAQQGLPLKQVMSPKDLQQPLQTSYSSQGPSLHGPMGQHMGPQSAHLSGSISSLNQSLPGQPGAVIGGQLPTSQSFAQPLSMHVTPRQQLTSPQLLQQPTQQPPAQIPPQQQAQSLESTYQSPQQAFSQLQHQLQQMQPSPASKQQPAWNGSVQQPVSSGFSVSAATAGTGSSPVGPTASTLASSSAVVAGPTVCNWTEHTSPEGYKYYYNSITKESKWEKPEELTLFEQRQQQAQQKQTVPATQAQAQAQAQVQSQMQLSGAASLPTQPQLGSFQQSQSQMQMRHQASMMYQTPGSLVNPMAQDLGYDLQQPRGSIDAARIQQGLQAAQQWMWKHNRAGT